MKKLTFLFTFFFLFPWGLAAASLSQAETDYQKNDFASAKKQYEQLIPQSTGPEKYQSQLRLVACEYHLGEFLNAAKAIYGYELPTQAIWKARFLLYRIYLAQQVMNRYNQILNEHEISTPQAAEDVSTWTRPQWMQQIDRDYRQLWDLRTQLMNAPIEQENLILTLKDTDTRRIPTLFDFTVQNWINFLDQVGREFQPAPLAKEDNFRFLNGTTRLKEGRQKDALALHAQILKEAFLLTGTNRANARVFWQTDFILLPFEHQGDFVQNDSQQALQYATTQLHLLSQFDTPKIPFWKKFTTSTPTEDTTYARGYTLWKTANLLNQHQQAPQALAVCQYATSLPASYFTQSCAQLAADITRVTFTPSLPDDAINRNAPTITFSGKNLHALYARVYTTSFEELLSFYQKNNPKSAVHDWSSVFLAPNQDNLKNFLKRTPIHTLTQSVTYEEVAKGQQGTLSLPALKPGLYVVLLSAQKDFDADKSPLQAVLLNATDLALFATAAIEGDPADFTALRNTPDKKLQPNLFHLYAVNLATGLPVPQLPLEMITQWEGTRQTAQTDSNGVLSLARAITVSTNRGRNNSYQLNALGRQKDSLAYTSTLYFSFYNPDPVYLVAQTDRPIYRPGQKVHLAVQGFERRVRGWQTLGGESVEFKVRDSNWKNIFSTKIALNSMGTGQVSFSLPQETLLGNYTAEISLPSNGHTYSTSHSFRVEEFKRPDYEVTLNEPEKALEYQKATHLTGQANYYFGAPLSQAKVVYTLSRQAYVPPFYWWWTRWVRVQEETLLQGETKTDENGKFSIPFTPTRAEEDEEFTQFVLKAEVYDESGRPIETSRTSTVSAHPHLFKVDFAQGFYDANTQTVLAKVDLTDAEGKSTTGQIHIKALQLVNQTPQKPSENPCSFHYCRNQAYSLEQMYQKTPVQTTAFEKNISFNTPGAQEILLPSLPEGVYRLELTSAKAAPQQMIFIVAGASSKLLLPDITLAQHTTYYPGEKMRILLGAANLQGSKRVELYQANAFLIHKALLAGGTTVFEFPLTQAMRGGLSLRWFGASNYTFHSGTASVEIPFDDKKLTVKTEVPTELKPGANANWKITARDASGSAVNGQVSATVYDQSLDYYVKNVPTLQFSNLYTQKNGTPSSVQSNIPGFIRGLGGPSSQVKQTFSLAALPFINLSFHARPYLSKGMRRAMNGGTGGVARAMMSAKSMDFAAADGAVQSLAMEESVEAEETANTRNMKLSADDDSTNSAIRTDFAETAYFNAAVPLKNGQAQLQFTLPQSLTTWNIFGYVLTRTADFGAFTAQTLTRKDFMLRLTLPRFYREGDKGVLQAAVTNQTKRSLTTQVTLNITQEKTNVLRAWGVQTPVQTITVPANSTRFVTWEITAPQAPDLYQITAVARSGKDSDGEQKELPVLPAKQRLLASAHVALKNGTNTLKLTELQNVPTEEVELTTLTLNPSLALSVLQSLPNILSNPHQNLVSSLNRYVPLAVVHQFYTTYPQLKEAVKKLPKRTGRTASWNETNPLRLELLSQTPWLLQAQGRQEQQANLISLFDDKIVATYLAKELKTIAKFQNASGAFTWFAGGPDDEYLTLYALEAFAQAQAYQAEVPQAAAQKAFRFIYPKIEAQLKQDKEGSVSTVAYALYAAYTLSGFPPTWPSYNTAKTYLKRWVDYADQYAKFMTPLGQIYAAAIYHRLGDDVKANRYLDLVLSRLKEDPLTGAYFAPEPQSWIWYNDTLTTQTVTLRTLLEVRPQAPQIDTMTQWLLFNRQVNDWSDSKAAAQAVFTLLDVMKAKGALSAPTKYAVQWGHIQKNLSFEPMDWTEDLQFVQTGSQITPQVYQAQITKEGKITDFASLNAIYRASEVEASPAGVINVERRYFRRKKEGNQIKLLPLEKGETLQVGDELEVHLTLTTNSAFEYVLVKDPKPAGFESTELISGWNWQPVSFYREVRDSSTNFFINWLPNGTVTFRYVLRPTLSGKFQAAAAQAQSMYAPEYGAHSASTLLPVVK